MKRMMFLTLLAFALVGGSVAPVSAQKVCPPGQHLVQGRMFGDKCYPNRGPATTCAARHRVCKPDGTCAKVCN